MIKTFQFRDAQQLAAENPGTFETPSRNQMERLSIGDFAQVNAEGERFWCRVIFTRGNDVLGIVDNDLDEIDKHGLQGGDIVAFEKRHIYKVLPDDKRKKLKPFMLLSHPEDAHTGSLHVMHTRYPHMIAEIQLQGEVKAKDVKWIDEPEDYEAVAPDLLKKMADWFFYNYVKKK